VYIEQKIIVSKLIVFVCKKTTPGGFLIHKKNTLSISYSSSFLFKKLQTSKNVFYDYMKVKCKLIDYKV